MRHERGCNIDCSFRKQRLERAAQPQPLRRCFSAPASEPNLIMAIDDSGSMDFEVVLPGNDGSGVVARGEPPPEAVRRRRAGALSVV